MNHPRPGRRARFQLGVSVPDGDASTFVGPASGTVTLGRAAGNDLVLRDKTVSKTHAQIEVGRAECRLRDLTSANGTRVNGSDIGRGGLVVLSDGDEIEIGRSRLVFEPLRHEADGDLPHEAEPEAMPKEPAPTDDEPQDVREQFEGYDVTTPLASFGVVTVDVAFDRSTRRTVTLTRIPQSAVGFFSKGKFLKRCHELLGLRHESLLAPTACGRAGGAFFIVAPHLAGVTAQAVLAEGRRGALPVPAAAYVAERLAQALAYLEAEKGGTQRPEVSDQTVVIAPSGRVGLRGVGVPSLGSVPSRFLAPEEETGRGGGMRAAVFALGVVLYELLAREAIDPADKATLRRIDAIRVEVSRGLAEIVMRAVETRPEDRFDSAAAFAEALQEELGSRTLPYGETELRAWVAKQFPNLVKG